MAAFKNRFLSACFGKFLFLLNDHSYNFLLAFKVNTCRKKVEGEIGEKVNDFVLWAVWGREKNLKKIWQQ